MKQYNLSELCICIEDVLSSNLGTTYWVRTEIASLSVRGHCYMELVEKAPNNTIAAKVRATCWNHVYGILAPYFTSETGETLSVGMQVLLEVEITFHAIYGLSLNIVGIDPTFTLGDMARQRQATIQRLRDDGIFDMQRDLPLPSTPKHIAIISSADAAGYGDFCHQLTSNAYGFLFHTQLFPAIMQGEQSPTSIIRALEQIALQADSYDIVVIVRGGGATTDLHHFDDYDLASHCAQFPLPIVAGIGHTRDVSIVDMVVHTSVKTPTAAAEWLINLMLLQSQKLQEMQHRLSRVIQQAISNEQQRLVQFKQRIHWVAHSHLQRQRTQLSLWEKTITLHSPEHIYRMGYSLTKVGGKVVKSIADVHAGEQIQTHVADGTIVSEVL